VARLIQQCTEAAAAYVSRFAVNRGCGRKANSGRHKFPHHELQRDLMAQAIASLALLPCVHLGEYS
jgi:hypothetical protein